MFDDYEDFEDEYDESVDIPAPIWYEDESVYCPFGLGDDDGFCTRDKWGCHAEGCPSAEPND